MNKHEICVHIKDDEMLQKAKELLEKHREKINEYYFFLDKVNLNYIQFSMDWHLNPKNRLLTEITLDQLEGILKK